MRNHYTLVLFVIASLTTLRSTGQCTNLNLYPANAIEPDVAGAVTQITGCSYQTEYSQLTGMVAGTGYRFTISDGSHITVHQGAPNGPVLGFGLSPLTVVTNSTEDLYAHWNTNAACGNSTACLVTTVQRLVGCVPPTVTATTVNDCLNDQFFVSVDVADAGDAGSLSFAYTVNGGNLSVQSGIMPGTYELGPFMLGALVDLTVVHGDNSDCNAELPGISDSSCVVLSCGPDTYTHCYGNDETYLITYQSPSAYPIQLLFNSGEVSASGNDALVIYDGLDDTAPVLFSGVGNAGDLSGVSALSTNPDHAVTLKFISNSSFSCADGGVSTEWNYTVGCSDCIPALAEAGPVNTDCEASQYTVDVIISVLGTDTELEIANDAGVASTFADAPGSYTAGPFPVGTPVQITLVNDQNALCTTTLGTFENGFCPTQIDCDAPLFTDTYCYIDNDARSWLYLSSGAGSLALQFSAGSIEQVAYDHLRLYDGVDNTAPVLWEHTTSSNFNLTGVSVVSTGPALYMEMTSDYSVSCGAGSFVPWVWSVGCLECTNNSATFEVLPDCLHHAYSVAVNVADLGSAPDLRIAIAGSADTLSGVGVGTTLVGPFAAGTPTTLTVMNSDDHLCRVVSPVLVFSGEACVVAACEPIEVEYCYADADTVWFVYSSGTNIPVTITFISGQLLPNDNVLLYNGIDTNAQLVFAGNLGGDLSGLALSSSNPDNALTILITSDATGSCASGDASPTIQWTVGCGLVGSEETSASVPLVFPQPCDQELNIRWPVAKGSAVILELFDVAGRCALRESYRDVPGAGHNADVRSLRSGSYMLRLTSQGGVYSGPVIIAR